MATTWNTSDAGAGISFSNGNLTATFSNASYTSVRSTNSPAKTAGKWHAEFTMTTIVNNQPLVGLMDSSASLASFAGHDTHGIGIDIEPGNGKFEVFQNGVVINTYTITPASGDIIAMEIDIPNSLVWWKDVTQNSGWTNASNNTLTGSPATGVGGTSFTLTSSGGVMLAGSGLNTAGNNVITLNPGPNFSGAVSSGFSSWDAPVSSFHSFLSGFTI